MSKVLFVCSDTKAFTYECKYALKDKWRLYCSDECKGYTEDEKKLKLSSCNLVIVNVVNDKNDLKLLNLAEYKKIAVLRNHEPRGVKWANNSYLRCDAICKYKDQHLITDFKDVDTLIKSLQAVEIEGDSDCSFVIKKGVRYLLFCLNYVK